MASLECVNGILQWNMLIFNFCILICVWHGHVPENYGQWWWSYDGEHSFRSMWIITNSEGTVLVICIILWFQCHRSHFISYEVSHILVSLFQKTEWVSSAFDDFGDFSKVCKPTKSKSVGHSDKPSMKRKKINRSETFPTTVSSSQKKSIKSDSTALWAEKYAPSTLVRMCYEFGVYS